MNSIIVLLKDTNNGAMADEIPILPNELAPVIKSVYVRSKYYSTKTYKDKPVMLVYTDDFEHCIPNELNPDNTGKDKMIKQAGYDSDKIYCNVEDTSQPIASLAYYRPIYVENIFPDKTYLCEDYALPDGYNINDNIVRLYDNSYIINLPKNFVGYISFDYSTNYRRMRKESDRYMYDCTIQIAKKGRIRPLFNNTSHSTAEYERVLKLSNASSFDINFSE